MTPRKPKVHKVSKQTQLKRQYEKLTLATHRFLNESQDRHGDNPELEAIQLNRMARAVNKIRALKLMNKGRK